MRPYYVTRGRRNGRSRTGYYHGPVSRFGTLAEAEASAMELMVTAVQYFPHDYVAVGEGAQSEGLSVGRGRRICEYMVRGGEIVRHECD